jgi:cell division protein FtsQ
MDGGGRVLRSLGAMNASFGIEAKPRPAFAGLPSARNGASPTVAARQRRAAPNSYAAPPLVPRLLGTFLLVVLFLGVGLLGAMRGGEYDTFVAANGPPKDVLARSFGLGINMVEVNGATRLSNQEIVAAAGIDGKGSLLFTDVAALRERLKINPMIAEASVRKLYPHALAISVAERKAFALWQKDGDVWLVAADGTPIDRLRDTRYVDLPLVVGKGANEMAKAFASLIDAQPTLKPLVRAGNWVGQRHWELQLKSGLMVELPEVNPEGALALFAGWMRDYKLGEKAIILVDLRLPDRVTFRLTEEASDERNEEMKKRLPTTKGEPG